MRAGNPQGGSPEVLIRALGISAGWNLLTRTKESTRCWAARFGSLLLFFQLSAEQHSRFLIVLPSACRRNDCCVWLCTGST